jgi:DNA-binding response OmpR family regulator
MADQNKQTPSVFIVDDDKFLTDMYSVKFLESKFAVEVAPNCTDALAKLGGGYRPDIVLLDVVMPGLSGLDFLKAAKERKLLDGVKVVILSNLGQKEDIEKGMANGADGYIVKANCTPSEVVDKIKSCLKIND